MYSRPPTESASVLVDPREAERERDPDAERSAAGAPPPMITLIDDRLQQHRERDHRVDRTRSDGRAAAARATAAADADRRSRCTSAIAAAPSADPEREPRRDEDPGEDVAAERGRCRAGGPSSAPGCAGGSRSSSPSSLEAAAGANDREERRSAPTIDERRRSPLGAREEGARDRRRRAADGAAPAELGAPSPSGLLRQRARIDDAEQDVDDRVDHDDGDAEHER